MKQSDTLKLEYNSLIHLVVSVSYHVICLFSRVWLCDPMIHQAPLSMGFSRQEYWSGLPVPSPGTLPDPEIKPGSPTFQADSLPSEPPGKPCQYNL